MMSCKLQQKLDLHQVDLMHRITMILEGLDLEGRREDLSKEWALPDTEHL